MAKNTHGGRREGAGRKAREETATVGFRVNKKALEKCREKYGRKLNAKINTFIKKLASEDDESNITT